ncbi:MAG: DUF1840 domain-containing protein [Thiotrichaceae bacterium]
MLVEFTSPAGPKIEMTEKMATKIIRMMGYENPNIPSAVSAEDIDKVLESLKVAVATEAQKELPEDSDDKPDSFMDLPVSIKSRAFPITDLLQRASKKKTYVMWEYNQLSAALD